MASSRRDFLKKGSLVALVAGVPIGLAEKIVASGPDTPSRTLGLTQEDFRRQLNTKFLIRRGAKKVSVKLVAVDSLGSKEARAHGKECFGVIFRGDRPNALKQDTYLIEHSKLGEFSFLLVPIGMNDKEAMYYEAIINHVNA